MLEVKNITVKGRKGKTILNNVSFSLAAGEFCAVIGPNGAGKSTLVKTIAGLVRPCAGGAFLNEAPLAAMTRAQSARSIAYLPQSSPCVPCSVFSAVLLGRKPHISWRPEENDRKLTTDMLAELKLSELSGECITRLSGGEFQKVLIGRALVQETPVLILDEPVNHLDIRNQLEILESVASSTKKRNMATLVVLHDLGYALRYADKVLLLHNGERIYMGTPAGISEEDLSLAYGLPISLENMGGMLRALF